MSLMWIKKPSVVSSQLNLAYVTRNKKTSKLVGSHAAKFLVI